MIDRFVAMAREAGRSWTEIGEALGAPEQMAPERPAATAWPKDFDAAARAVRLPHPSTSYSPLSAQDTGVAVQILTDTGIADEQLRRRLSELLAG